MATNIAGCTDTGFAIIKLKVARWTGAINTDWHTAGNLNINKVPTASPHLIIPGGTINACIVSTADAVAASIQVRNGAVFQATNNRVVLIQVNACSCRRINL